MKLYTYDYDSSYDPPFPTVVVEILPSRGEQIVTLNALLDSGSDVTMIPIKVLKRVGARKVAKQHIRGISGISYAVEMYRVRLRFAEQEMFITVASDKQNQPMLLGRDILNHFSITLNGLANVVEIPSTES